MKKVLVLLAVAALATSCGSVGFVSTPSEYNSAGESVSYVKKNTNVLGLSAMNAQSEAQKGLESLKGKCPNGVTNVTSTVSAKSIAIVLFEKIELSGNCK